MLIKKIIEFELWWPGPPKCILKTVHVLLKLVIFMTKQKSSTQIFEWIIYCIQLKILLEAIYTLLPPTRNKSLTKFNLKMQDFVLCFVLDL